MSTSVFVLEADDRTRAFVVDQLLADGYRAVGADAPERARAALHPCAVDLTILGDVQPRAAAPELLRWIRRVDAITRPAVLVLSGRCSELDVVRAFDAGADDFVAKPFSYPELRCRIGALLRRRRDASESRWIVRGDLRVDRAARELICAGVPLALTRVEFDLLETLALRSHRVVSRAELLREVWQYPDPAVARTRTVDAHINRLRRKLEAAGVPRALVSCRGVGYRLVPDNATGLTGACAEHHADPRMPAASPRANG